MHILNSLFGGGEGSTRLLGSVRRGFERFETFKATLGVPEDVKPKKKEKKKVRAALAECSV